MSDYQQKIYQERILTNKSAGKKFERKRNVMATLRTIVFLATLIVVVYWANVREMEWMIASFILGIMAFVFFLDRFIHFRDLLKYHQALIGINEEEIQRANGELRDDFMGGSEFGKGDHAYAYDLDIFGSPSIYLLVNRCATQLGRLNLANWLKNKASKKEIQQRQTAIAELSPMIDWRQDFQARGIIHAPKQESLNPFLVWLKEFDDLFISAYMKIGSKVAPVLALGGLLCYFYFDLPVSLLIIGILGNLFFIRKTANKITVAIEKTDSCVKALKSYALLMEAFETQQFKAGKLQTLQQQLTANNSGSVAISRLAKILYHLEMRKNAYFYLLVNIFLLYDLQWMIELEKWRRDYADQVESWLEAIAEIEALQSLASYRFANPSFIFPEIADESFLIQAESLGHPLIAESGRVCNDFEMIGRGKTTIITGSNMSGKSTFERTLGVNMVLAFCGAPVCAKSFKISLFDIFTSMRVQDSLEENVSGFYAELRRIQQLLERLEPEDAEHVFFLLDEVLKGTNSKDRQNGARALIRQLSQKNAFGLISTHDLELGDLEEKFPDLAQNFSFNSQVVDGKLSFAYKISKGVCHSFSATKLMQSIGIIIDD